MKWGNYQVCPSIASERTDSEMASFLTFAGSLRKNTGAGMICTLVCRIIVVCQEISAHSLLLKTQSMLPSLVFSLIANPLGSLAVSALPDSPPTVCRRHRRIQCHHRARYRSSMTKQDTHTEADRNGALQAFLREAICEANIFENFRTCKCAMCASSFGMYYSFWDTLSVEV